MISTAMNSLTRRKNIYIFQGCQDQEIIGILPERDSVTIRLTKPGDMPTWVKGQYFKLELESVWLTLFRSTDTNTEELYHVTKMVYYQ